MEQIKIVIQVHLRVNGYYLYLLLEEKKVDRKSDIKMNSLFKFLKY